ncbi:MAG: retropepsin-like aspartic protease [Candidatus Dadabacteria bacterium]|nr:retropepsin-like aspartic protease [Candidatus Dadabacteria bacterium]
MPFFSGLISPRKQILIDVLLGRPSVAPNHKSSYVALVDTGATITCISPKVIKNLKLTPVGKNPIQAATQKTNTNLYHVSFHIPIAQAQGKNLKIHFHSNSNMQVAEIIQPPDYDVLLGMDVLETCSLFIASGRFTLGY